MKKSGHAFIEIFVCMRSYGCAMRINSSYKLTNGDVLEKVRTKSNLCKSTVKIIMQCIRHLMQYGQLVMGLYEREEHRRCRTRQVLRDEEVMKEA